MTTIIRTSLRFRGYFPHRANPHTEIWLWKTSSWSLRSTRCLICYLMSFVLLSLSMVAALTRHLGIAVTKRWHSLRKTNMETVQTTVAFIFPWTQCEVAVTPQWTQNQQKRISDVSSSANVWWHYEKFPNQRTSSWYTRSRGYLTNRRGWIRAHFSNFPLRQPVQSM